MTRPTDRARPVGLGAVTLLMCLFNGAWLLVMRPHGMSTKTLWLTSGSLVAISFLVIWYFWLGRNWARWLVLVASVVALANLAFLGFLGSGEKLIAVGEGALAIWLLVWLNTRSVRTFFSGRADLGGA